MIKSWRVSLSGPAEAGSRNGHWHWDFVSKERVGDRWQWHHPQGKLARPYAQTQIRLAVLGRARTDLGRRLGQRHRHNGRGAQLPVRWWARLAPPARQDMLNDGSERVEFVPGSRQGAGLPEDCHGPVVQRAVE